MLLPTLRYKANSKNDTLECKVASCLSSENFTLEHNGLKVTREGGERNEKKEGGW